MISRHIRSTRLVALLITVLTLAGCALPSSGPGKAEIYQSAVDQQGARMAFDLHLPNTNAHRVELALPGRHAVQNALGAAAVAWELGVPADDIVGGLQAFSGVGRRFEPIGTVALSGGREVLAFEDYGHHPTELDAVIRAARGGWPDKRLVLVFQPHRFTRTRDQFDAFARVLAEPDVLILADVYPAGESPIPGIDSDALAQAIAQRGDEPVVRIQQVDQAMASIDAECRDGDLLLIMGAGDVGRLGQTMKRGAA